MNTVPCTYDATANDFGEVVQGCSSDGTTPVDLLSSVSFSSYTLDLSFASLPIITWTDTASDTLTFTPTSGLLVDSFSGAENVSIYYLGTFSGDSYTTIANNASVSLAFTQTGGSTGAVNFSGTFATPPGTPPSPEPGTMTLLGAALVGLGFMGRKKFGR